MKVGQPAEMPKVSAPSTAASDAAAPAKVRQEAAATASSTASSSGVAVTVSTAVRNLEQANRGEADIDTDKVNAVRTAIEQGTYVVNPEVIADKLLANAQEMLNRTHN